MRTLTRVYALRKEITQHDWDFVLKQISQRYSVKLENLDNDNTPGAHFQIETEAPSLSEAAANLNNAFEELKAKGYIHEYKLI